MADGANKTTPTAADVGAFVDSVADDHRRADAWLLLEIMRAATGQPPVMWGTSIVGFGSRHYRYASGREGDVPAVSFSPRKAQTVPYLTGGPAEYATCCPGSGSIRPAKGCLYLKRVDQADAAILREIAARSYRFAATG